MTCISKQICAPGFYNAAALNEMPVCNEYDAGKNHVGFFFLIYLGIFIDNFGFWPSLCHKFCINHMHLCYARINYVCKKHTITNTQLAQIFRFPLSICGKQEQKMPRKGTSYCFWVTTLQKAVKPNSLKVQFDAVSFKMEKVPSSLHPFKFICIPGCHEERLVQWVMMGPLLLHRPTHHSFSIVPTPFANSNTPHKFSPTEAELLHIALQIPNILLFPIASVSLENKA